MQAWLDLRPFAFWKYPMRPYKPAMAKANRELEQQAHAMDADAVIDIQHSMRDWLEGTAIRYLTPYDCNDAPDRQYDEDECRNKRGSSVMRYSASGAISFTLRA